MAIPSPNATVCGAHGPGSAGAPILRILATSDLHMRMLGWDYAADGPEPGVGLLGLAGPIAALRAESEATVLLDNGDFLQGTLLGDWHVAEWRRGDDRKQPMIAAMEALGYDAATLGNHETDYGLDYLSAVVAGAGFPILSSNLRAAEEDRPAIPGQQPWTVLERSLTDANGRSHPLRIGVLGVLPPQTMLWNHRVLQGRARVAAVVAAAAQAVAALRAAGADVIIALSHSGIAALDSEEAQEHASLALARVPGIDAIVAGHSHLVFPGPDHAGIPGVDCALGTLAGTPAVMPGRWGSHLGRIDLALARTEAGGWSVTGHAVAAHPAPGSDPGRAVPAEILEAHEGARSWGATCVGRSAVPLHTYFAPLQGGAALDLMARAQVWGLMQHLDDPALRSLPVLSAVSPFRSGGQAGPVGYVDIAPGPVSRAAATTLFPFPNLLCALVVDGAGLRDWLDHSVAQFAHIVPGAGDRPLLGARWVAHNFDVMHGLRYRVDLAVPPRAAGAAAPSRIRDIVHRGSPVIDDSRFLIVTNEYRANGGGGFPGCRPDAVVAGTDLAARDALEGYLATCGPFRPDGAETVFDFTPVSRARAIFPTGPAAARHFDARAMPKIERIGGHADGFDRYRVSLS